MKRSKRRFQDFMDRSFAHFRKLQSDDVESAGRRVLQRLRKQPEWESGSTQTDATLVANSRISPYAMAAAAAAIVFAAFVSSVLFRDAPPQNTGTGGGVHSGESTLILPDGSRIEQRPAADFSFERTATGVRVRLHKGSIFVRAAKQQAGRHLEVETPHLQVTVVGTAFLLEAEELRSRVTVLEGTVRVKEGETERTLRAPEQITSVPRTETARPVQQEPPAAPLAFEVVSIRPNPDGGIAAGPRAAGGAPQSCVGISQLTPGRFISRRISAYQLFLIAYGIPDRSVAQEVGRVTGGPSWFNTECFEIEATIPAGPSPYIERQIIRRGTAATILAPGSRLQEMLQNMLADRFKLVVRREMKEIPVYELAAAKGGPKLASWNAGNNPDWVTGWSSGYQDKDGGNAANIRGARAPLSTLVSYLRLATGKPILDRVDLPGEFNFYIEYAPIDPTHLPAGLEFSSGSSKPSLFTALEKELGLKLEEKREPMETFAIERVEKPTEN
jgi:uncharacterized protein (TIGR03435 family)